MDRRFYCPEIPEVGGVVELSGEESHHIQSVLRGRTGERLLLLDGQGLIATAEIIECGGRRRPVSCSIRDHNRTPPKPFRWHLYVSPTRGKGMAGIIRCATELGVSEIIPILCDRATSRPEKSAAVQWHSAAISGIKQSINPYCPTIHEPSQLMDVLEQEIPPGYIGWVPEVNEGGAMQRVAGNKVSLFIGPEGGFTPEEAAAIQARGIQPVSFGPYVLRVETAVVAGLGCLNSLYKQV